jgi:hypothetical protein
VLGYVEMLAEKRANEYLLRFSGFVVPRNPVLIKNNPPPLPLVGVAHFLSPYLRFYDFISDFVISSTSEKGHRKELKSHQSAPVPTEIE